MKGIASFVLAGGKSSRMGRDKSTILLHGRTLLDRACELARTAGESIAVVGSTPQVTAEAARLHLPLISDVFSGQGPLAGIHAALGSEFATDLNLILAVDTPFITPEFVLYLIDRARASGAEVAAPRIDGRLHPLCAVYRQSFAKHASAALQAGHNKIEDAIAAGGLDDVSETDLRTRGFSTVMFANLNTPEELALAEARIVPVIG